MNVRQTVSAPISSNAVSSSAASTPVPHHRQRVRYFAFIWTGLTLLIGACTFISVYAATGIAVSRGIAPVGILPPADSGGGPAVLVQITATPASPAATTAATVAAPAGGPTPTIVPIRDLDFDLGIAVQNSREAGTYTNWVKMAGDQLRLNWVKAQIVWRDVESTKGQIDFGELDAALPQLNKANIKVLLSIVKAPDWARDKGAAIKHDVNDGPPADPKDLANFITVILKKYPGMIHAIEVFNEVNLDREWSTGPQKLDAARYVTMLQVAHDAIKAVDPNIIVISAALSPTGGNGNPTQAVDDFAYLDQLIKANVLKYADCVGVHHNGYNFSPMYEFNNIPERTPKAKFRGPWDNPHHSWSFRSTLEGYAKKIKDAGSTTKLCVTEFGWPTVEGLTGKARSGFEFAADNSLADQADFTNQAIAFMKSTGTVRLAFLWNLNYGAQAGWDVAGPSGDNVLYSILGPNFQARPVWQKIVDRNFRGQARQASPQ